MVLANIGFESLEWTLATDGIEGLHVTPTAGTVDAQGTALITISYASARTFSRADQTQERMLDGLSRSSTM